MKRAFTILLFLLILTSIAQAGVDVQLNSSTGDYVGGGLSYQYNDTDSTISLTAYADRISMRINQASSGQYWYLDFKTPGDFVSDGYFYALRYPVQGPVAPGLSVTGNGRGCNQIAGRFVVHDVVVSNNVVQQLALDFQQFCDANTVPLTGSIRVNSAVPVPYDLPVAYAGNYIRFDEGGPMALSAHNSYSELGYALSYQWSQLSGLPVTITAPNAATTTFVAPTDLKLGGEDFVFQVLVFDTTGASASDNVTIHIASKSDPQTFLEMQSDPGDYVGQGKNWFYNLDNALFSVNRNADNSVSATVTANGTWSLNFAPLLGGELSPGTYSDVLRFGSQTTTQPGMNVFGFGRACASVTGLFEVIDNEPITDSFFARFRQQCGDPAGPSLRGTLAVNALHPSVPVANAGADQTVKEFDLVSLDGTASADDINGSIMAYAWTQTAGPTVVLSDPAASQPTFVAPVLADGKLSDTLRFELLVTDDLGFKAKDEVIITLLPGNHAPVANDDQATTYRKESVEIAVLNNDSDDGQLDVTTVRIVNPPSHGRVYVNDNGSVVYRPSRRFIGTDTFTYTVDDNLGVTSNQATVTISVIK